MPEHLFIGLTTHDRLSELFETGASVKTTRLTEKFDYPAFRELYLRDDPSFPRLAY